MSPQPTSFVIIFIVITIVITSNRNHSYFFRQAGDFLKTLPLILTLKISLSIHTDFSSQSIELTPGCDLDSRPS